MNVYWSRCFLCAALLASIMVLTGVRADSTDWTTISQVQYTTGGILYASFDFHWIARWDQMFDGGSPGNSIESSYGSLNDGYRASGLPGGMRQMMLGMDQAVILYPGSPCSVYVRKAQWTLWPTTGEDECVVDINRGDGWIYLASVKPTTGMLSVRRTKSAAGNWTLVGAPDFLNASARTSSPILKSSRNGTVFVGAQDASVGNRLTVMKYDSLTGSWVHVGTPGFATFEYASLSISSTGTPHVWQALTATMYVYNDTANSWTAAASAVTTVDNAPIGRVVVPHDGEYLTVGMTGQTAQHMDGRLMSINVTSRKWEISSVILKSSYSSSDPTCQSDVYSDPTMTISDDGTPYLYLVTKDNPCSALALLKIMRVKRALRKNCAIGMYALPEACAVCPPGKSTAWIGSYQCTVACAPGTFSAISTLGQCRLCPANTFNSKFGQGSCEPCPTGTYAVVPGSTTCLPCPVVAGGYDCPCAAGEKKVGLSCIPCVAGTYNQQLNSTSCVECMPGHYRSESMVASEPCAACPPGHFASSNRTALCTPCPPSTYGPPTTGHISAEVCLACPAGLTSAAGQVNVTACTSCPAGYKSAGTAGCVSNAAIRFSITPGSYAILLLMFTMIFMCLA